MTSQAPDLTRSNFQITVNAQANNVLGGSLTLHGRAAAIEVAPGEDCCMLMPHQDFKLHFFHLNFLSTLRD